MRKLASIFSISLLLIIAGIFIYGCHSGLDRSSLIEKYAQPPSQFIEIEGLNVHYRETGKGIPVVLLHGVASSLHTWRFWQPELAKHFRVISIDVPAFGLTGPFPDNLYSLKRYMKFFDELTEKLAIDSAYLVGNSFGGLLTWNYALHNPQNVKKAVLVDAAGFPRKMKDIDLGFLLCQSPYTSWFSRLFTPREIVQHSIKNAYKDDSKITDEQIDIYFDLLVCEGNREAFSHVLNMLVDKEDNTEKLKSLTQPTLIMWGDDDQLIPLEKAHRFHELIPNSEFKYL